MVICVGAILNSVWHTLDITKKTSRDADPLLRLSKKISPNGRTNNIPLSAK